MSKVRKILIVFLVACISVCISIAVAACDKNGNYPDYKNPTNGIINPGDGEFGGQYTVKVTSMGGIALNGVEVGFKKNGVTQASAVSRNGEISINLAPDVYELEVKADSLPAGYYLTDEKFETSAESGNVEIKLPSKVISAAAPSNKSYALRDVMYDFSYTPATGSERKLLSDLVGKYKAVMLNFWYVGCNPCRVEFPAIEQAYQQFKDRIAIIAISSQDTAAAIKNFQTENGYTFDMTYDTAGIESRFGVGSWPTTVIVDRYGVIAYRSSGNQTSSSVWASLFAKYTADDYEQPGDSGDEEENPGDSFEYKKPSADMEAPDYSQVITGNAVLGDGAAGKVTAISVETNENDAETSWPWYVEDGSTSYLYASNSNETPTFAIMYIDFSLKSGDILSYDYNYSTAESDRIYVLMDTTRLATYTGNSDGWKTEQAVYIASQDINITLSFTYIKNDVATDTPVKNDFAYIGNISVINVEDITEPIDFARPATYLGITPDDLVLGDDGFYHVHAPNTLYDGGLLLVDLWGSTAWSLNHLGSSTFVTTNENSTYPASMYYISFWEFSNYLTNTSSGVTYDYTQYSNYLNLLLDAQKYSKNGYVPVTPTVRTILEQFCIRFKDSNFSNGKYSEDEWLEMCTVYEHHNGEHESGEFCNKTDDPIYGLTIFDSIPAHESTVNHANIDVMFVSVGGFYYSFEAPRDGVYKIYSDYRGSNIDPDMYVYRWDGNNDIPVGIYDSNPGNAQRGTNFIGYLYLTQGEVIYMMMSVGMNSTGSFDFYIEYVGESYNWLRTAAYDGTWVGRVDENGNWLSGATYNAIPWALREDGYYYTYSTDEKGNFVEWGSIIYIDFVNINFHDIGTTSPRTLLQLIEAGLFNLKEFFRPDFTALVTSYYYQSIDGKDVNDELYGKIEASEELVAMIAEMLEYRTIDGDALETGFWLSMAYYYEYVGPQN